MIGIWWNGQEDELERLVFIDLDQLPEGERARGVDLMSHVIGLQRQIAGTGYNPKKVALVGLAPKMQLLPPLRLIGFGDWLREAIPDALELVDGANMREIGILLQSLPPWAVMALDIGHVSEITGLVATRVGFSRR